MTTIFPNNENATSASNHQSKLLCEILDVLNPGDNYAYFKYFVRYKLVSVVYSKQEIFL